MTNLEVEAQAADDAKASGLGPASDEAEIVEVLHEYMDELELTEEQQDLYFATFITVLLFS